MIEINLILQQLREYSNGKEWVNDDIMHDNNKNNSPSSASIGKDSAASLELMNSELSLARHLLFGADNIILVATVVCPWAVDGVVDDGENDSAPLHGDNTNNNEDNKVRNWRLDILVA